MSVSQEGRARFQDGPSNSGPAAPPLDGPEVLVASYPAGGTYRLEPHADGARLWRTKAPALPGDADAERVKLEEVNRRNRALYGQPPVGSRR